MCGKRGSGQQTGQSSFTSASLSFSISMRKFCLLSRSVPRALGSSGRTVHCLGAVLQGARGQSAAGLLLSLPCLDILGVMTTESLTSTGAGARGLSLGRREADMCRVLPAAQSNECMTFGLQQAPACHGREADQMPGMAPSLMHYNP